MKKNRFLCGLLIVVLSLGMLSGCAGNEEEDFGVADSFVNSEESDDPNNSEDPKEEDPQNETPDDQDPEENDPADEDPAPSADPDEEPPKEEDPKEEDPKEETPKEEDPSQEETPADPEEELPPITKENSGTAITLLAQNVKHGGGGLGTKGDGHGNNLYNRIRRFKALVQYHQPDVIFFQEARIGSIQFMETDDPWFSQTYTILWKYRHPTVAGGSQAEPLLYKTDKYKELESGFFWLSSTPDRPSKCYDSEAEYGNIVTWAWLQDKATGVKFYVCSAHSEGDYSDRVTIGYIKCMEQFMKELKKLKEDEFGFIGGDFNIKYRTPAYEETFDWTVMVDLQDMAKNMYRDGLCELGGTNGSSNSGWVDNNPMDEIDKNPGRKSQRDHIIAKLHPNMAVDYWGFDYTRYAYPEDEVHEGFISDHYGLICKVRINTNVDYSRYQKVYDGPTWGV